MLSVHATDGVQVLLAGFLDKISKVFPKQQAEINGNGRQTPGPGEPKGLGVWPCYSPVCIKLAGIDSRIDSGFPDTTLGFRNAPTEPWFCRRWACHGCLSFYPLICQGSPNKISIPHPLQSMYHVTLEECSRTFLTISNGVEVRQSHVPTAGLGLFTSRLFEFDEVVTYIHGNLVAYGDALALTETCYLRNLLSHELLINGARGPAMSMTGGASYANDQGHYWNGKFDTIFKLEGTIPVCVILCSAADPS